MYHRLRRLCLLQLGIKIVGEIKLVAIREVKFLALRVRPENPIRVFFVHEAPYCKCQGIG